MSEFRDTFGHCHINSVGCSVGEIMDATLKELRSAIDAVLAEEKARIVKEVIAEYKTSEPNKSKAKAKAAVSTPKRNAKPATKEKAAATG